MSLREEMWKYEQITGESAEHVPIIKLGAFLDGYEKGIKALGRTSYKSEARRWKRRYLDLKQRIFKMEERTSWIPCSERLPEDYVHVLCQFTLGGMGECYLAHGMFHVVGGLVMTCNEVIAWMPLPQPYEVESEVTE